VTLVNVPPVPSGGREHGTTALAYVVFPPSVEATARPSAAAALAKSRFPGHARVTGVVPARETMTDIIVAKLSLVELATGLLVALVVGLHFRSVAAPLAALLIIAVSYLLASRIIPWLAERVGVDVPREVAPMIVVLLFGALTDYTIFFLSRCRAQLASGAERLEAARETTRRLAGIVTVAAAIVSGASCVLVLARFEFFRDFGPGMAAAIAIGWLVVVTLAPALLAILGRALFWPSAVDEREGRMPTRRRALRLIVRHPTPTTVLVIALLAVGCAGLTQVHLANPVILGLPRDSGVEAGYRDVEAGFGPGFVAPTLIVIRGEGLDGRAGALARLQREIGRRPGVDAVLGPRDIPLRGAHGALVSRDGRTARLALVLHGNPLAAPAIAQIGDLRHDLPALLRRAGLGGASALVGGDTALSADTISLTLDDLARIAPAVVLVVALLLALYLRAIVVPLVLVCGSALGLAAALGATGWIWQRLAGDALAYYVPFAVAVLLLSLGSDYGVLLVGRMWRASRTLPAREAIAEASARATRPITTAGLVLSLSFALLALVPLWQFRQFAIAMCIGLVLDAFVIRPLLVPAAVSLATRLGAAPARR
jgi:RND superfamily putative drug exporter